MSTFGTRSKWTFFNALQNLHGHEALAYNAVWSTQQCTFVGPSDDRTVGMYYDGKAWMDMAMYQCDPMGLWPRLLTHSRCLENEF